jgi:FO synthase
LGRRVAARRTSSAGSPWPHLEELSRETARAGKLLHERLTVYPKYVQRPDVWLSEPLRHRVLDLVDATGLPRIDAWSPGEASSPPADVLAAIRGPNVAASAEVASIIERAKRGEDLSEREVVSLFNARGDDFTAIVHAADAIRQQVNGDVVSYVVNRNINYTNVCYFKCQFCAFSKGSCPRTALPPI